MNSARPAKTALSSHMMFCNVTFLQPVSIRGNTSKLFPVEEQFQAGVVGNELTPAASENYSQVKTTSLTVLGT